MRNFNDDWIRIIAVLTMSPIPDPINLCMECPVPVDVGYFWTLLQHWGREIDSLAGPWENIKANGEVTLDIGVSWLGNSVAFRVVCWKKCIIEVLRSIYEANTSLSPLITLDEADDYIDEPGDNGTVWICRTSTVDRWWKQSRRNSWALWCWFTLHPLYMPSW